MDSLFGTIRRGLFFCSLVLCCLCTAISGCGDNRDSDGTTAGASVWRENKKKSQAKRVLIIHSYHREYEWVAGVNRGVRKALEGMEVDLEAYYMDTKRRSDQGWKRQAGEAALQVVEQWRPDVVITVDDNAQEYVGRFLAGRNVPSVVFCGVNAEMKSYGYPAKNVTGILERPLFEESIRYLKSMIPDISRVAFVTDKSPTSMGVIEYFKTLKPDAQITSWSTPGTMDEWKAAIAKGQQEAQAIAIYTYHTVSVPGNPRNVLPSEVMAWTVANSRVPILGFVTFAMDDGALCGVVVSSVEQGLRAGRMARGILLGKKTEDFPVEVTKSAMTMLNMATAEKLGISINQDVMLTTDIVTGG